MDKEIDRLLDQSLQKLPDLLLDRFRRLVLDVVDVVDVDYAIIFLCSVFYGVVRMQILSTLTPSPVLSLMYFPNPPFFTSALE